MFYVYVYCDPTKPYSDPTKPYSGLFKCEPFYVGKGKDKRFITHWNNIKRNKSTHNRRLTSRLVWLRDNNMEPIIIKYKTDLSNLDSYLIENDLIVSLGRVDLDFEGILTNRSSGFDWLNETDLLTINKKEYYKRKYYPQDIINSIIDLYKDNNGLVKIRKILNNKFDLAISVNTIRELLVINSVRIRTKSETRIGENNPMYGKKRIPTKGFIGKKHNSVSKSKTSIALQEIYFAKLDLEIATTVINLYNDGVNITQITKLVECSRTKIENIIKHYLNGGVSLRFPTLKVIHGVSRDT